MDSINAVISDTVMKRFSADAIDAVYVSEGEDSDGDIIIKVTIVLKKDFSAIDEKAMIGLVRHIRSNLRESDTKAIGSKLRIASDFPLISYVSKKEYRKFKSEAA